MLGGTLSSVSDSLCDSVNHLRDSEIITAQTCHLVHMSHMITFPPGSVFSL